MAMVQLYCNNSLRNFNYLFICDYTGATWIIDPLSVEMIEQEIHKSGARPVAIINTHGHHDHIAGNKELIQKYNCPLLRFKGGEIVSLGQQYRAHVYYTPGHTMDHYTLMITEDSQPKYLVSGDTLFYLGVGNCKNGGDRIQLANSIMNLYQNFSDQLMVLPGHDYFLNNLQFSLSLMPSDEKLNSLWAKLQRRELLTTSLLRTLKEEREENLFFRLSNVELKKCLNLGSTNSEQEIFLALRAMRDTW